MTTNLRVGDTFPNFELPDRAHHPLGVAYRREYIRLNAVVTRCLQDTRYAAWTRDHVEAV